MCFCLSNDGKDTYLCLCTLDKTYIVTICIIWLTRGNGFLNWSTKHHYLYALTTSNDNNNIIIDQSKTFEKFYIYSIKQCCGRTWTLWWGIGLIVCPEICQIRQEQNDTYLRFNLIKREWHWINLVFLKETSTTGFFTHLHETIPAGIYT